MSLHPEFGENEIRHNKPEVLPDFSIGHEDSYARVIDPKEILELDHGQRITILEEEFIGKPVSSSRINVKRSQNDGTLSYEARLRLNPLLIDDSVGKENFLNAICPKNMYNFADIDELCFERLKDADAVFVSTESGAEFMIHYTQAEHSAPEIIISNKHWVSSRDAEEIFAVRPTLEDDQEKQKEFTEFLKTYMFVMSMTPENVDSEARQRMNFPPERYFIEPKADKAVHFLGNYDSDRSLVYDSAAFKILMQRGLDSTTGYFDFGEDISTLAGLPQIVMNQLEILRGKFYQTSEETDSRPRGVVIAGPDKKRAAEIAEAFANSINGNFKSVSSTEIVNRSNARTTSNIIGLMEDLLVLEEPVVLFIEDASDIFRKVRRSSRRTVEAFGRTLSQATDEKPNLIVFTAEDKLENLPFELWGLQRFNWQIEIPKPTALERKEIFTALIASHMVEDAVRDEANYYSILKRVNIAKATLRSSGLTASDIDEVLELAKLHQFRARQRKSLNDVGPVTTELLCRVINEYKKRRKH